ncbi:MAG: DUF4957 domain-containing protein [Prevotella sp.]|nr:DUF4957 domain-containing protein [Prevotella sp.]
MNKNQNSSRKRLFTWAWQGCLMLGAAGLLLTSCADDGFADESFVSGDGVTNTQLTSPSADNITITATTDKAYTLISWKVVYGAGGYDCKVYDVTDEEPVVLVDSIIDNTTFSVKREEDRNYIFAIKTLGNTKLGNTDALDATQVKFNSFLEAFQSISTGTDLYTYFKENPIPTEDVEGEICYDLEAGGSYTISGPLDFGGSYVVLRSTDKNNRPTITYTTGTETGTDDEGNETTTNTVGSINTSAPMTLQNLKFDCSQVPDETKNIAAIYLSATPDESIKAKTGGGSYYNIMDGAIYITNCDFEGVKGMFLYDNNKAYCVENLLISNSRVHFTVPSQQANLAYIYTPGGFVKDVTIKNSTFWNTGAGDLQYVIRYNNSGRLDRAGYDRNSQTQSVNLLNSTFYHVGYGWFANYNGFAGQVYTNFDIENNIFVDAGKGGSGVARRLLGGRAATSYGKCVFQYNTYWTNGAPEAEGAPGQEGPSYDLSGTALQTDPALVNPDNGDLTPTGSEQVEHKTGDPFWFE